MILTENQGPFEVPYAREDGFLVGTASVICETASQPGVLLVFGFEPG